MVRYAKPDRLDDALALLGEGQWQLLAGGTDFYPALGSRPLKQDVLDVSGISELRGVAENDEHIIIGASTTWTDLCRASLPASFDALKQAAREVGSVQIQNTGTVAGNLCNASPAADGVPALLVLDAVVELRSAKSERRLPLREFVLGNRKTALAPDEMVTSIRVPKASTLGRSHFSKLGARRYLVISIAVVAARLEFSNAGTIASAAVAVGACSAVAQRLAGLEASLVGLDASADFDAHVDHAHFDLLTPIDDVRASADYRREAAREIIVRTLATLAASAHAPLSVGSDVAA